MDKIKQLKKAYKKRFNKQLNKTVLNTDISGTILFVEHLKYLRDMYILTQKSINIISTLNAAIEEFEAFRSNQKDFHWNNFCEIIKLNMREWVAVNDSI
jgi:hypothetical protein